MKVRIKVLGKPGSGKTSLTFTIAQFLHEKFGIKCVIKDEEADLVTRDPARIANAMRSIAESAEVEIETVQTHPTTDEPPGPLPLYKMLVEQITEALGLPCEPSSTGLLNHIRALVRARAHLNHDITFQPQNHLPPGSFEVCVRGRSAGVLLSNGDFQSVKELWLTANEMSEIANRFQLLKIQVDAWYAEGTRLQSILRPDIRVVVESVNPNNPKLFKGIHEAGSVFEECAYQYFVPAEGKPA